MMDARIGSPMLPARSDARRYRARSPLSNTAESHEMLQRGSAKDELSHVVPSKEKSTKFTPEVSSEAVPPRVTIPENTEPFSAASKLDAGGVRSTWISCELICALLPAASK